MRRRRIGVILPPPQFVANPGSQTDVALEIQARATVVATDGPRAAAFVVWSRHAAFRDHGVVDYTIERSIPVPPYFRIAMEYLRARKGWKVQTIVRTDAGEEIVVWRVTWLKSKGLARARVEERRLARNKRKTKKVPPQLRLIQGGKR